MLCASQLYAQNRTISGTVTSKDDGLPLPGVSVTVPGTTIGTQTNGSGKYTLSVPATAKNLSFSFIGFTTQQVSIGSSSNVSVTLYASQKQLTEVVVLGYGNTSTKQTYTGAATVVSGDQLNKKRVDNVGQALAGEVAGVRVINTSGQPGTEPTIRIRGFGSVNGNRSPLFVVDGVPYSGSLNAINMQDVESTTVLKDANATAIYGSRGSNGVVVITTKSGKNKKPYIEGEANFGTNADLISRYDVITSPEQYTALSWEGLYNEGVLTGNANPTNYANTRLFSSAGLPPAYNIWNAAAAALINPTTREFNSGISRKYDPEKWSDYAFRHSAHTDVNVRMGGGNEKAGYFMSLGYLDDVGYSIGSDYQRFTGRVNLTNQVKPWLEAKMNLNYAHSKQNKNGQTNDSGSIFWFVDNTPPIYGVFLRDASGNYVPDPIFGGNQFDYGNTGRKFASLTNAIADATYDTNRDDRDEINGNASLNATIIPGLTFENTLGYQWSNTANVLRNNKFYGSEASQHGFIGLDRINISSIDVTNLLRYKKKFGDHNFEVMAAHEFSTYKTSDFNAGKTNLVENDDESLDNAVTQSGLPSSSSSAYKVDSYFGQATYDYQSKYFLTGTIRRDGSSRFVKNRWGTFGSVGAGWLISEESFMKSQNIVTNLKIKASYGLTGDQFGVGYYSGYTTSEVSPDGNGGVSIGVPVPGNPDLTWETAHMLNAGVEFSLGHFLDGEIDFYQKNTINEIFQRRVGISNGYATINVNDGKLRNTGFEFDLTGHILKTKNYHIDLGVNGEILKNRITAMPIDPSTGQQQIVSPQGAYGYAVGHSIYDFYVRKFTGVNPQTGASQWDTYWVDLNGDGQPQTGTIEGGTGEYISSKAAFANYVKTHQNVTGINKPIQETTTENYPDATTQYTGQSAVPTVRGAFNLTAGYKGLDLSVQFLYSLGGYSYDAAYASLMDDGSVGNNNWSTDILKRWQKPGDVTNVPALTDAYNASVNLTSSRFITKADYLALNNVRLSYTFPKALFSKLGLDNLSVWVSGDNLYLASHRKGFNPAISESGASSIYTYSPLSTLSAGLRVKF